MVVQSHYSKRKSPRLKGYDYAECGFYFLTLCSYRRRNIFGKISKNANVILSTLGLVVEDCWMSIPEHVPGVSVDSFVIMPNHLHGIVQIMQPDSYTVSHVVGLFKASVSRRARQFTDLSIWQRSFHDQIIRNEDSLFAIRASPIHC